MPSYTRLAAVALIFVLSAQWSLATPDRSYTCVGCHGSTQADGYNDGRLTLLSPTGTINPAERVGATDRGTLPFYQLLPGGSRTISVQTNGTMNPNNGFFTNNYQKLGVVNGNTPAITADAGWTQRPHSAGAYWSRTSYNSGTTYSYNLTIPTTVLPDFYEMEIGWAGLGGNDSGLKRFYVQVLAALPGQWSNTGNGSWSGAGNWTSLVPNSVGATANFSTAITADSTVTTDVAVTAGSINFDNTRRYTLAGANAITLDVASGNAAINVTSGSHAISAPLVVNDNLAIAVNSAASTLTVSSSIAAGAAVSLSKSGPGTLVLASAPNYAAATNVNGGAMAFEAGTIGTLSVANAAKASVLAGGNKALRTAAFLVTGTGALDLNNNGLVVTNGSIVNLKTAIAAGYAAGAWNGSGINSTAATASGGIGAVGYALAGDALAISGASTAIFLGKTVTPTDLLARYTLYGDADLSGSVSLDDFTRLAANFGAAGDWPQGDFDFDGTANLDDFTALAANFGQSVPAALRPDIVPEPAAGATLALIAMAALAKRGRN